ncbi:hypothetical protein G5I_05268 [Acromyrmex echinatior]|uniref:Uncharacterized protein n=1 Tax=Acromyrmex echinatior TaxID=103372 RepID=F4WHZ9_ACREC|nr:hypothetical protein G5I_05268 [Acromyrmex echinatior]
MSVFAYEKGEESARNFSDWLVEESRIEQPDSSCRGKSVDVRNGRTNESEHTTEERGSTQFHSVSLAFVKNGQPVTLLLVEGAAGVAFAMEDRRSEDERVRSRLSLGSLASSFSPRKSVLAGGAFTASQIAPVTDRTYLFLLEAVRKRPQDSARHHAVVHPISPAAGRDGGLPSGGHLFPPAGHLLELHQSNVHSYTLYESSVHLYRVRLHNNSPLDSQRSPHSWDNMSCLRSAGMIHSADSYVRASCIHRAAFITLRVRTYRHLYSTFHTVCVFSRPSSGPGPESPRCLVVEREEEGREIEKERKGTWRTVDYDEIKVQASCRQ